MQLRLSSYEWKTFLNRAGMENIALNLLTCIERLQERDNIDSNSTLKDKENEHVDLSFLLSPRLKKKSIIEDMNLKRQESRTSLSGVTSLQQIMKSKSAPFLSHDNEENEEGGEDSEGGQNMGARDSVMSDNTLVGASILDHLLEPFQVCVFTLYFCVVYCLSLIHI